MCMTLLVDTTPLNGFFKKKKKKIDRFLSCLVCKVARYILMAVDKLKYLAHICIFIKDLYVLYSYGVIRQMC